LHPVDFDLTGPAEWRGGIAQGPGNFILARSLPVECGVNRVLLRSTTVPGKIVLTARSAGLASAQLELTSSAVTTTDGWSLTHPGDGLTGRLDLGPTPAGPSFTPSRRSVTIASVTAGSNAAEAGLSCDDNEITAWTSGDDVAQAWIEYRFDGPADVNNATFKLTGWRERTYPIRILIEGQEVWRGTTTRTLGYVTIPFKTTRGQTVRVELVGAGTSGDAFNLTELTDQANAATGSNRVLARSLSIIEAEFYEPAASR
jgi:hypothetical protein